MFAPQLRREVRHGRVDREQAISIEQGLRQGRFTLSKPVRTSARVIAVMDARSPTCCR